MYNQNTSQAVHINVHITILYNILPSTKLNLQDMILNWNLLT